MTATNGPFQLDDIVRVEASRCVSVNTTNMATERTVLQGVEETVSKFTIDCVHCKRQFEILVALRMMILFSFSSEDGGSMFLRNVDKNLRVYTSSHDYNLTVFFPAS
jgi:hypothetical protein